MLKLPHKISSQLIVILSRVFQNAGRAVSVFCALVCLVFQVSQAEVNPTVKELMPLLKPAKATDKMVKGDFIDAQARMIRILEFLERVDGSNGRDGKSILTNAFYIYERDRFSGHRRMLTEMSITQSWRKARELGLFNEADKFSPIIRKGAEKGEKAIFEYSIPPKLKPVFSTDLSNLRLVSPGERRTNGGTELTAAEKGYLEHMTWIEQEILEGRPDELGRTPVENLALWQAEVDKAGDAFKNTEPLLRVGGKLTANPSSLSQNRWRVTFDVSNLSRLPTEVTAEFYVFAMARNGGQVYLMKRGKKLLKLRASESHDFEVWTSEKKGDVRFRGWAIHIRHNGKIIDKKSSQEIIEELVEKQASLPKLGAPKKRSRRSRR